jgi:hypothetical protein
MVFALQNDFEAISDFIEVALASQKEVSPTR